MQNDGIAYEGYYGFADIASGKLITRDSMFRQEDASNLFASVVLGMLYEEGKFLYSDPLSTICPSIPTPRSSSLLPTARCRLFLCLVPDGAYCDCNHVWSAEYCATDRPRQ